MKRIGSILLLFGVMAIVMDFFNAVPRLLVWIYNWGDSVAWGIKVSLVIVGTILWWLGKSADDTEAAEQDFDNK